VPLGVRLDASASVDIDATPIATYSFDAGDGSDPVTQTGAVANHTYASVGTFTPRVTVTDTGGKASAATATITTTAAPPADACLSQAPVKLLAGVQTKRYKTSVTTHLAVDARTASWTQVDAWPISITGTGSVCWDGGSVVGTYASSTSWDTFHHTGAFSIANPSSIIDDFRAFNYGDGFNLRSGATDWRIQGAHVTFMHDDCVQNDYLYAGVISDSLFDGCYVGLSANPGSSDTTSNGSNRTVTIQGTLLRLEPMPTVYKGTAPGHGGFFKWDDTLRAPKLSLHDNIFRVDQPPNHGTLGLPPGYDVSCSGNTIVWLGTGAFPGAASWLAKCPDTRIVTTTSTWDDAVGIWTALH
jgi:PKD repeat protein